MFKKRFWIWIFVLSVIFIDIPFLLIVKGPAILSSPWGQTQILHQINSRIPGKVAFKSIDLQWVGIQKIEGLSLQGPDGENILNIPSLQIEASLFQLIKNAFESPLKLEFTDINGQIASDVEGRLNVQKALNLFPNANPAAMKPFTLHFSHMSGSLSLLDKALALVLKGNIKNPEGLDANLSLTGQITDGIVTLSQPLKVAFAITPKLSKSFLKGLTPIFGAILSAETKGTLTLEPEGFSYPINSQTFHSIEIGRLTLDLGKVTFDTQGQINSLLSWLNAKPSEYIPVWFTPIYLEMHAGKVRMQRMDMLVMDEYPLATWGTVDFPKDKIHLTIGLRGKTLENIAKGSKTDDNAMLQIPFKGKIGQASLDKSKIAKQISSFAHIVNGTLETLGLGILSGLAKATLPESTAPDPTTTPFPWDSQQQDPDKNTLIKK